MQTWDDLVLVQSKCLVKGAVIKSPIWLVWTVRVNNEYLFWNRPGQILHERHIGVSVPICHARFSTVLNHTDTVNSALAQDAITNLFGLFLVKLHSSCITKARCVYESESSVSDPNYIFYGITCLRLHPSSSLIFYPWIVYCSSLIQNTWIPSFVDFSNVRKKVQKWCLARSCRTQYQNAVVLLIRCACELENFIQDRAGVFNFVQAIFFFFFLFLF